MESTVEVKRGLGGKQFVNFADLVQLSSFPLWGELKAPFQKLKDKYHH